MIESTDYYCELDNHYSWRLYNIDSENNYTLIDRSHTSPTRFGASVMWPAQYGPGIDHCTAFTSTHSNSTTDNYHPFIQMAQGEYWVEVRESNWSSDPQKKIIARITEEAEPFLNTRGIAPSLFPSLFSGLHLYRTRSTIAESILLLLSYVLNMNIRYILCGVENSPLNQFSIPLANDSKTPSYLLDCTDKTQTATYWSSTAYNDMNDACKILLQPATISGSNYDLGQVTYTLISDLENKVPNYDKIKAAYNTLTSSSITQTISQNNLPNNVFPNVRWYLHQWVYALSFKKYTPFKVNVYSDSGVTKCEIYWYNADLGYTYDASAKYISPSFLSSNFLA